MTILELFALKNTITVMLSECFFFVFLFFRILLFVKKLYVTTMVGPEGGGVFKVFKIA